MKGKFIIEIGEDGIQMDGEGNTLHHPLNGVYASNAGEDIGSYGYLSFAGHDLADSSILDDVRVFHLLFYGEPDEEANREAWADPIRAEILQRLCNKNQTWYIGALLYDSGIQVGSPKHNAADEAFINDADAKTSKNIAIIRSEKPFGQGYGCIDKPLFEVADNSIAQAVKKCWPNAIQGIPIEGYLYESKSIHLIKEWDSKPRDDKLFRSVIDKITLAFYTFPAEHCHFAFVTNKFSLGEFRAAINIEELQSKAQRIGEAYFK